VFLQGVSEPGGPGHALRWIQSTWRHGLTPRGFSDPRHRYRSHGVVIDELRAEKNRLIRNLCTSDRILGNSLDPLSRHLRLTALSYSTTRLPKYPTLLPGCGSRGLSRLPMETRRRSEQSCRRRLRRSSFDLVIRASPLAPNFELWLSVILVGSNRSQAHGSVTEQRCGKSSLLGRQRTSLCAGDIWIDKETRALRRQLMQPRVEYVNLFALPKPNARRAAHLTSA